MRAIPVPVASAEEPKLFGDKIMYLRFRLDDGSILKMLDISENETQAQGPFLIGKGPEVEMA
jgi:hypothetical protein